MSRETTSLPYISKKEYFFGIMKQFHIQLDTMKSTGEIRFYKKGKKYFMTVLMVKVSYEESTDKLIISNYEADFKTGSTTKFTQFNNLKIPQDMMFAASKKVKTIADVNGYLNLDKFMGMINDKWTSYASLMNQDATLKPRVETKKFREAAIKGGDMISIDHILIYSKIAQDLEYFKEDWMDAVEMLHDVDDPEQSESYPDEVNAKIAKIEEILESGDENKIREIFQKIVSGGVENVDV